MTTSDERLICINALKLNLCRIFGKKTNNQQSDGSTTEAYRQTTKVQLDWFQQTHGISDSGTANQKG